MCSSDLICFCSPRPLSLRAACASRNSAQRPTAALLFGPLAQTLARVLIRAILAVRDDRTVQRSFRSIKKAGSAAGGEEELEGRAAVAVVVVSVPGHRLRRRRRRRELQERRGARGGNEIWVSPPAAGQAVLFGRNARRTVG